MGWRSTTLGSPPPCAARRPANAPTPAERATCAPWLDAEWRLTGADVRVIIALGGFAWRAALQMIRSAGGTVGSPAPQFGHGATAALNTSHGDVTLIGCYHPSQQNTFTGRLTPQMLDDIFRQAAEALALRSTPNSGELRFGQRDKVGRGEVLIVLDSPLVEDLQDPEHQAVLQSLGQIVAHRTRATADAEYIVRPMSARRPTHR